MAQAPTKLPTGKKDQWIISCNSLGQESCRAKVSRIFRYFVPSFAPDFAPNFPRIVRRLFALRFVGDGDQKQKKNQQKSPSFLNAKFPGKHEKKKCTKSSEEQAK